MNQVGSTKDIVSQSITGVTDDLGNSVVSTSTGFGSSPLGVSARAQSLYGIANPNFNLTPPAPDSPIEDQSNPLPFWSIDNGSDGQMTATSVFDATTKTFGIELNPGTAAIDSTLTLTTRSYLLTDDNLALRQRALSVLSKSGTAGGTASQWNLTLTAIYYDATATALSTAVIGTALDTATWTSISGTTTPGGSAISSSAQYVDLSFKMTATAAVTGSAKATIKSLLLQTSTFGSQSFLVADTFTSSGDWVRPTGVDYLTAVVLVSGAGGGAGGSISDEVSVSAGTSLSMAGGGGGGGGFFAIARDLYVGDAGTWTVTVGAGGSGGTARTKVKASGSANPTYGPPETLIGGLGSNGGATSFGTYITLAGGTGGSASGSAGNSNTLGFQFGAAGTAGSVTTNLIFGIGTATGGNGGRGGFGSAVVSGTSYTTTAGTPGAAGMTSTLKVFPYIDTLPVAGSAGGTSVGSISAGGTAYSGTAGSGGETGIGGGGGGGAGIQVQNPNTITSPVAGVGGSGGGGGGGASLLLNFSNNNATISGTAGDGGAGGSASAGGGGAGGVIFARYDNNYSGLTLDYKSGAGGNGGGGFVVIVYVG